MAAYLPPLCPAGKFVPGIPKKGATLVLVAIVLHSLADPVLAQNDKPPDALTLLQRCSRSQSLAKHISFSGETRVHSAASGVENMNFVVKYSYRRHDDRVNVSGRWIYPDDSNQESYQFREVVGKTYWVYYTFPFAKSKGPVDANASQQRAKYTDKLTGMMYYSVPLSGCFEAFGGACLSDMMLNGTGCRLLDPESIGGTLCQVVVATTKYGAAREWIAPEKGYAASKIELVKAANDIIYDGKTIGQLGYQKEIGGRKLALESWAAVVDNIHLQAINGHFVPVSGHYTATYYYTGQKSVVIEADFTRTDIAIAPAFDDDKDFQSDLPEGSRIFNEDDNTSGVVYTWKNHQVVPAVPDGPGQTAAGRFARPSPGQTAAGTWVRPSPDQTAPSMFAVPPLVTKVVWAWTGIALIAVAVSLLIRNSRKKPPNG